MQSFSMARAAEHSGGNPGGQRVRSGRPRASVWSVSQICTQAAGFAPFSRAVVAV